MKGALEKLYYAVSSSFWFIPLVLSLAALCGAWLTLQFDFSYGAYRLTAWLPGPPVTQEGARLVVSAVAGSMITAASLVFSMTLVALSFVSQQLGPRIILRFMEDRPTQIVLGAFVATFIYSLIVLGVIGTRYDTNFIPVLSVYVSALLAILSLALMIHFIHHIATNIQADAVVAALGHQLLAAIEARDKRHAELSKFIPSQEYDRYREAIHAEGHAIAATGSGYIQSIDEAGAVDLAQQNGLKIAFALRPGQFVLEGTPLAYVSLSNSDDSDNVNGDIEDLCILGERRTRQQNIEFEINALVEVALRALSPSMNDPLTAVACANRMFVGLAKLTCRSGQARVLVSQEDEAVAFPLPQDFGHYLNAAVTPLRRAGKSDLILVCNLLGLLRDLGLTTDDKEDLDAIRDQVRALLLDCKEFYQSEPDREKLRSVAHEALEAVGGQNGTDVI